MEAGLGVASSGPAADLLWLHPGGAMATVCLRALQAGGPGLTPGREDVLATQKGGPAQGWAFLQEAPGGHLGCWTECDLQPRHGRVIGLGCS